MVFGSEPPALSTPGILSSSAASTAAGTGVSSCFLILTEGKSQIPDLNRAPGSPEGVCTTPSTNGADKAPWGHINFENKTSPGTSECPSAVFQPFKFMGSHFLNGLGWFCGTAEQSTGMIQVPNPSPRCLIPIPAFPCRAFLCFSAQK